MSCFTPGLESDFLRLCDTVSLTVHQADALLKCIDLANQHPDQAPNGAVMTLALGGVAGLLERAEVAADVLKDLTQSHEQDFKAKH